VEMGFVRTLELAKEYVIDVDDHDPYERLGRYYPWIYELDE
jgi:hypothetical protein